MGFAPRRGIRRFASVLTYQPRPDAIEWLRQYFLIYEGEYVTNLSNELESSRHELTPLSFMFGSSDSFYARYENSYDALVADFEISDGVVIQAGDYDWNRGILGFQTATKRAVSMEQEFSFGNFYDGDRTESKTEVNYLPSKHFGTTLGYTRQNVSLPGGDFSVKLASFTALVNITPDFTWSNVLQYDNISDTLGVNSRLIWEYHPGKRIFLVLNQSYLDERTGLVLKQMDTTLKLSSIFRF
jgi:hypothetical protein